MNETLARRRCFNHAVREAAARCPECQRFYCRECVTEHEGRVLCVSCIAKSLPTETAKQTGRLGPFVGLLQYTAALLILWVVFFSIGRAILYVPSTFHESAFSQPFAAEDE